MKKLFLAEFIALIFVLGCTAVAAENHDDPGPHVRYGGTPIELHFDADAANVTKVYVDNTPCIILSADSKRQNASYSIAIDCNWGPR